MDPFLIWANCRFGGLPSLVMMEELVMNMVIVEFLCTSTSFQIFVFNFLLLLLNWVLSTTLWCIVKTGETSSIEKNIHKSVFKDGTILYLRLIYYASQEQEHGCDPTLDISEFINNSTTLVVGHDNSSQNKIGRFLALRTNDIILVLEILDGVREHLEKPPVSIFERNLAVVPLERLSLDTKTPQEQRHRALDPQVLTHDFECPQKRKSVRM